MDEEEIVWEPSDNPEKNVEYVQYLATKYGQQPSPINIDVINTTKLLLPKLHWINYDIMPKKIKITNTGKTMILSAKWHIGRPYLSGGSLDSKYIFSQIHFHWGDRPTEGGEHTIDGAKVPLEMHAMHFKKSYFNYKEALRHSDGIICTAYIFQFRSNHSPIMHKIVSAFHKIQLAETSIGIPPFLIMDLLYPFEYDYYLYWGCIEKTPILWMISREPTNISFEQLHLFNQLMRLNMAPIYKNWRNINLQSNDRQIFHINPSVLYTNSTLSPVSLRLKPSREILSKLPSNN